MNKRLRKKKRVGEFRELGSELLGDLRPGISDDDIDAFVDQPHCRRRSTEARLRRRRRA